MDIETAFNILTGDTDKNGNIQIGTTKSKVKDMCGEDWNESSWNRMTKFSRKNKITTSTPFYNKDKKLWFWI